MQTKTEDINQERNNKISIREAADLLGVSTATVNNWTREGLLKKEQGGLREKSVRKLAQDIQSGQTDRLRVRRNKQLSSGRSLYTGISLCRRNQNVLRRLLESLPEEEKKDRKGGHPGEKADQSRETARSREDFQICRILLNLALPLVRQAVPNESRSRFLPLLEDVAGRKLTKAEIALLKDKSPEQKFSNTDPLVPASRPAEDWTAEDRPAEDWAAEDHAAEDQEEPQPAFVPWEDFLGTALLSLHREGERKQSGSYYTPVKLAKHLFEMSSIRDEKAEDFRQSRRILDPCCGSGIFLLTARQMGVPLNQLYGIDLDPLSVSIARLNLALNESAARQPIRISRIRSQIVCADACRGNPFAAPFSLIIGNPPWGSSGVSVDEFVEKTADLLETGGKLSYVLPEAVLHVKLHQPLRRFLLQRFSFSSVYYAGEAFPGVQSPSILLSMVKDGKGSADGCLVEEKNGGRRFVLGAETKMDERRFDLDLTQEERFLLRKMEGPAGRIFLKGKVRFGLGIVTGNNRKFVRKDALTGSTDIAAEPVLLGRNVQAYMCAEPEMYLQFTPECFQQTAPEKMYRAPVKIVYRFICSHPVFAVDRKQRLTLNSCNFFIPETDISDCRLLYLLAVLNSSVIDFWWRKRFRSVKMLKSHIEQMPIPAVSRRKAAEIAELVSKGDLKGVQEKIFLLYHLTEEEIRLIME